ncbi:hypothetical protein JR316_0013166 [Psilocybe cubensis]|uniref:Uncharacterized protein n=2 Tax=Psilocybe cubensis TaxID=181762 RepID=A0ACB8GHK9_PSICU|nr:hypothetical protein JR316_0013166 [Psilocybe cubensis]KAH9474701.1 hypothetical protein JR316_0013166 [Psilocybe cubensis]
MKGELHSEERKSKHVHYRARHKKLEHLKKRMTEHGFKERIMVEDPQSQASEPKYCSVLLDSKEIHIIRMTRKNYVSAPSELDDIVCFHEITASSDTTQSADTEQLQLLRQYQQQSISDTPENRHVLPEEGYESSAVFRRYTMRDHEWPGRSHSDHCITQTYPPSASSLFAADVEKEFWGMHEASIFVWLIR